jgi:hypothetical protein
VPAGSSLATGTDPGTEPSPTATGHAASALGSDKPPVTSTIVDSVKSIVTNTPLQGAFAVGLLILVAYWLLVRWHDKRSRQRR